MKRRDNVNGVQNTLPYSVKFFIQKTKKGKIFSVYCRIITNRTKAELSLKQDVIKKDWDEKVGRYKLSSKHNNYLNHKLSEIEGHIQEIYLNLKRQGNPVVAFMIKDSMLGKRVGLNNYTLLTFLDDFIAEAKTKPQIYSPPTIQHYYALRSHLTNFFKSIRVKDITLEVLNRNVIDRFETWLLSWKHPILERSMNRNTANRYLTKLKAVIHNAIRKELITKNPFNGFTIRAVKPYRVFLTEEEIEKILNHDLGGNSSLIRVRDMFTFSVYTGLRFSDAFSLREENISKGNDGSLWITIEQIKTKEPLHIPMLKPAENIFNKYEEQRKYTGFALPRLSNQKLNLNLQQIANLVGINKKITHHVARHTFATTVTLEKNVDIKTVSKWLGHSTIKATEVYAQITKRHLSATAEKLNLGLTKKEGNVETVQ